MSVAEKSDPAELLAYCRDVAVRAQAASRALATVSGAEKSQWLRATAARLRASIDELVEKNQTDIEAAPSFGLTDAQTDRLRLSPERIEAMAIALEEIDALKDPIGEVLESTVRPNGLDVQKVRVPLGVVFFIYESRPNVTVDAAALCVKAGNAVILRGGKEAAHSNRALAALLAETASAAGLPDDAVQLVQTTDRDAVGHFLKMDEYINVVIPRGGEGLIRRVAEGARMPVIKHFAGNCHVYVDSHADLAMARGIVVNSKCQRLGVCNAAESLLVHADVAAEVLPELGADLASHGIEIRGDERVCELVDAAVPATDEDYAAEYLGPIISAKVVASVDAAIAHINAYSSHHTEAIVTRDLATARHFAAAVDSSAVMINASTRFNDGGEFGLGAEIGISTDKFHARGPCGLKELTSYKYIVYGAGQQRQ
ncbi:MAG: glutamate-5-semialdehyde dehydrogenase [Pirellulales bacterium]|nr:glutamate-5-semialdehyde dehydrogenase [Planctomycetales bacterium]